MLPKTGSDFVSDEEEMVSLAGIQRESGVYVLHRLNKYFYVAIQFFLCAREGMM